MRCHYEVLGVARDADDSEIKKAYRKLALKNHPDKHADAVDEYTKIFREIQAAYDVLSDRQERAWYDKNRDAILRGGEDYIDDSVDIMQYFNPGAYCGYNDGPDGFYTIFREVFRRLAEEEEPFLEGDSADEYDVPEFGESESDYQTIVNRFYSYWLGYCTKKTFSWKDMYDLRQAPNRPTQRLMEKENKKIRDGLKRKRNEEVRALVKYVRKRDRRVQEFVKKQEAEKAENKRRLEEKRVEEKRLRNEAMGNYKEQDWMAVDDRHLDVIDSHFDDEFGEANKLYGNDFSDDDSEIEMVEEFYCIACDKSFKSEKALSNHEKSKKHKENLELIKNEMDEELLQQLSLEDNKKLAGNSKEHSTPSSDLEDEDSLSTVDGVSGDFPQPIHRIDSMYLSQNIVLRNVIDRMEKPKELKMNPELSNLSYSTDSLVYMKEKGGVVKGSKKSKKKKKQNAQNPNEEFDEQNVEQWNKRHGAELGAYATDSLALPRRKSKKKELRESAIRLRNDEESLNQGTLSSSPLTDSLRIHRKKTSKSEKRRQQRSKLSAIDSCGSADDSGGKEENERTTTITTITTTTTITTEDLIESKDVKFAIGGDNFGDSKDTIMGSVGGAATNVDLQGDCPACLNDAGDTHQVTLNSHQQTRIISDSISYNKEKMEYHARNHIHKKNKQKNKQQQVSGCENGECDSSDSGCNDSSSDCEDSASDREDGSNKADDDVFDGSDENAHLCKSNNDNNSDLSGTTNVEQKKTVNKDSGKTKNAAKMVQTAVDGEKLSIDDNLLCSVCGFEFPSRNKLFAHIKAEGHAQLKQQQPQVGNKKQSKKGGKKKW